MVAQSIVVSVSAMTVPGMSTAIGGIEHGAPEVEKVAMGIIGIYSEVPESVSPCQGTVEVADATECRPLPIEQDVAEVAVTLLPVVTIHIIITGNSHQVVQIDFVGCLILLITQIQFISHLVCQEEGFIASLFVAHGIARSCYQQHQSQGGHYLLHTHLQFSVLHLFTLQK